MTALTCTSVRRLSGRILRQNIPIYQSVHRAQYAEDSTEVKLLSKPELTEEEIEAICNKSRLKTHDFLQNKGLAYISDKPVYLIEHHRLRWKRRQIGLFGFDCGQDPALCFTTKEEMEDQKEYEKVAFDKTIMEVREAELAKLAESKKVALEQEERVAAALETMQSWKDVIQERMREKEQIAEMAKNERARLLEEVRRFFGYSIDPNDERFQIMLQHKEDELQKQKRLEKKLKKEQLFIKKLASLERSGNSKAVQNEEDVDSEK